MQNFRTAAVAGFVLICSHILAADPLTVSPAFASNLPLRTVVGPMPPLDVEAVPVAPLIRVQPIAPAAALADAQLAVIRGPNAWRNWAALALARYTSGDYEKSYIAARQMRVAAEARNEPLPLAADELLAKCRRAAEALSLLE